MGPIEELRFLVVDDYAVMRRIVRGLLIEMGCQPPLEAADGAAALQLVRSGAVDFIISDINMPVMNGFDLLRAIKSSASLRDVPVLLITADACAHDHVMACQWGASGLMVKPFTLEQLQQRLLELARRVVATT